MKHYETLPSDYYADEHSARPYRQKALDLVWGYMARQGAPSFSKQLGLPRYCGDGGVKCTVGCLVQDPGLLESIEDLGVVELMKRERIPALVLPVDEGFLAGLQCAHDFSWRDSVRGGLPWWPLFTAQMVRLASDFGLRFLPKDEVPK